jgi:hypothetical protein
VSTSHLQWPYKYRNGSEVDSFASHPGVRDPAVAVQGEEYVSGAGERGEKQRTLTRMKLTRMKGTGEERDHGFGRSRHRTRAQGEQAR